MSEKVVVSCSNGHRFPVNLTKNKQRDHVFCPRCQDSVVVRKKHLFSPNPKWKDEKEEHRQLRREIKERSRKPKSLEWQVPIIPGFQTLSKAMMELLRAEKERENKTP